MFAAKKRVQRETATRETVNEPALIQARHNLRLDRPARAR